VSFDGKRAVVTGGASGIGLELVAKLDRDGAGVLAVDSNGDALDALARRNPAVQTLQLDVTVPGAADRIVAAAGDHVDLLFNNAGISDGILMLDETEDHEWDHCIAVNLTSAFRICRRVIPMMVAQHGGVIINTASVGGLRGARGGTAYVASKFGLVGLTQNIAATYGKDGIRCNAICPGPVATNLRHLAGVSTRGRSRLDSDPMMPKSANPAQVADVALLIASDECVLVNGVALPVDEGWLAY
jgi:NAD(P)-dependent dehydrogenase (short-subunit alcohol dehydrogenase family)